MSTATENCVGNMHQTYVVNKRNESRCLLNDRLHAWRLHKKSKGLRIVATLAESLGAPLSATEKRKSRKQEELMAKSSNDIIRKGNPIKLLLCPTSSNQIARRCADDKVRIEPRSLLSLRAQKHIKTSTHQSVSLQKHFTPSMCRSCLVDVWQAELSQPHHQHQAPLWP